jgi:hypothetical protein
MAHYSVIKAAMEAICARTTKSMIASPIPLHLTRLPTAQAYDFFTKNTALSASIKLSAMHIFVNLTVGTAGIRLPVAQ